VSQSSADHNVRSAAFGWMAKQPDKGVGREALGAKTNFIPDALNLERTRRQRRTRELVVLVMCSNL